MIVDIYDNNTLAGSLQKENDKYIFTYDINFLNSTSTAISLTLPKQKEPFISNFLHPFFSGLLSEGNLKEIQCKELKIDENDEFTRLIKTAQYDTIGTITIKEQV